MTPRDLYVAVELFVLNVFRRPLPVKGHDLHLPMQRHRRGEETLLAIASLIRKLSGDRECLAGGPERIAEGRGGAHF